MQGRGRGPCSLPVAAPVAFLGLNQLSKTDTAPTPKPGRSHRDFCFTSSALPVAVQVVAAARGRGTRRRKDLSRSSSTKECLHGHGEAPTPLAAPEVTTLRLAGRNQHRGAVVSSCTYHLVPSLAMVSDRAVSYGWRFRVLPHWQLEWAPGEEKVAWNIVYVMKARPAHTAPATGKHCQCNGKAIGAGGTQAEKGVGQPKEYALMASVKVKSDSDGRPSRGPGPPKSRRQSRLGPTAHYSGVSTGTLVAVGREAA